MFWFFNEIFVFIFAEVELQPVASCFMFCIFSWVIVFVFAGVELQPVASCLIGNGGCAHKCKHAAGGPICSCRKGYTLQADEKSCAGK